ncbi:hypothetical protein JCM10212_006753 [Sporobolomyces blumeae]
MVKLEELPALLSNTAMAVNRQEEPLDGRLILALGQGLACLAGALDRANARATCTARKRASAEPDPETSIPPKALRLTKEPNHPPTTRTPRTRPTVPPATPVVTRSRGVTGAASATATTSTTSATSSSRTNGDKHNPVEAGIKELGNKGGARAAIDDRIDDRLDEGECPDTAASRPGSSKGGNESSDLSSDETGGPSDHEAGGPENDEIGRSTEEGTGGPSNDEAERSWQDPTGVGGNQESEERASSGEDEESDRQDRNHRAVSSPKLGILAATSPLAVFANHLHLLACRRIQHTIGSLAQRYASTQTSRAGRSSMPLVDDRPEAIRDLRDLLETMETAEQETAHTDLVRALRSLEVSSRVHELQAAYRACKDTRKRRERFGKMPLSSINEIGAALGQNIKRWNKIIGEGRAWANWVYFGGFELLVVLVVLLQTEGRTPATTRSFRRVVLERQSYCKLLDSFDLAVHPYPFAEAAFNLFLIPTLHVLAAHGPYNILWRGVSGPLSFDGAESWFVEVRGRPSEPHDERGKERSRHLGFASATRTVQKRPVIYRVLERTDAAACRDDRTLRVVPSFDSPLVLALEGRDLVELSNHEDSLVQARVDKVLSLPRRRLTISDNIPLDTLFDHQAPIANLPTAFFCAGDEQAERRKGWDDADVTERNAMERAVEKDTTKKGLLNRMERAAQGDLTGRVERIPRDGRKISSLADLDTWTKGGGQIGSEPVFLSIPDAIIEIYAQDHPSPLLVLLPRDTYDTEIQSRYIESQRLLYPPELLHNLGLRCVDEGCEPCRSLPDVEMHPTPFQAPKLVAARPTRRPHNKRRRNTEIEATTEVTDRREGDRHVERRLPSLREKGVVVWDLSHWPPTKYGSVTREGTDDTGLAILRGTGNGAGGSWLDKTWTETLGHVATAYVEQQTLFIRLQSAILKELHPKEHTKLRSALAAIDGEGNGDHFPFDPWAANHRNAGHAQLAVHVDGDRLDALAHLAIFGQFEGGHPIYPELLLSVAGAQGSGIYFSPSQLVHGVSQVTSGIRFSSNSSQNGNFPTVPEL